MSGFSFCIDDYLAEASPVLGRMRVDGLTETAVPFAERAVLLWRRGSPTPDMEFNDLTDVLKVWYCLSFCAQPRSECASPPRCQGFAWMCCAP